MPCPHCDDTGWRPLPGTRRVVRCDCRREQSARRLFERAQIPPSYAKCEFESFVTYPNEALLRAVSRARAFAEAFPAVDKGLVFVGPPGIGKTHLAVAVLRHAMRRTGARGLFYDTRDLLSRIRSTYNPSIRTAEMDVLRPVMEAELLVLDDLGAERLTDWVEETMNLIVNTRYNQRRSTIFTSNWEDDPDPENLNSLLVRVGFRMRSRLHRMCEFLEYTGTDYSDPSLPPKPTAEELYKLWKGQPRRKLPDRTSGRARAQLRQEKLDLGWTGGKAGS